MFGQKEYLCRNKSYYELLSDPSKISLKLQGGIMDDEEAQKFTSLKFYKDAITLRKYDDEGKIPYIKMKKIDDYRDLIASQLINKKKLFDKIFQITKLRAKFSL